MKNLWILISLLALALFAGCAPEEEGTDVDGEDTEVTTDDETVDLDDAGDADGGDTASAGEFETFTEAGEGVVGTWTVQVSEDQRSQISEETAAAREQGEAALEGADEATAAQIQAQLDQIPTVEEQVQMMEEGVQFELQEDGTFTLSVNLMGMQDSQTGTYTLEGNEVVMTFDDEAAEPVTMTYDEDENTLTGEQMGETVTLVRQ
jgi:hypothetical protein